MGCENRRKWGVREGESGVRERERVGCERGREWDVRERVGCERVG